MSYLVFFIVTTQFDRSWHFHIIFGVDYTYMIDHVIVLFGIRHKLHPIQSVTTTQYHLFT